MAENTPPKPRCRGACCLADIPGLDLFPRQIAAAVDDSRYRRSGSFRGPLLMRCWPGAL